MNPAVKSENHFAVRVSSPATQSATAGGSAFRHPAVKLKS